MVVLLMKYGADASLRDGEGCSCIHLSAQFGHTAIVAYFLARGDNVNLLDKNGMTPLMWSAYRVTRLVYCFSLVITLHWAIITLLNFKFNVFFR